MVKPDRTKTPVQNMNTPLNNLADAVVPDNAIAFAFATAVRILLHKESSAAARASALTEIRAQIAEWKGCVNEATSKGGGDVALLTLLRDIVLKMSVAIDGLSSGTGAGGRTVQLITPQQWCGAVSYTHLTLPTIYSV